MKKADASQLGLFDPPPCAPAGFKPGVPKKSAHYIDVARSVTRSTEEAMALHRSVSADLLAKGREIATEIATREGTVHSRKVLAAMGARGLVDPEKGQTWIGAVFRGGFVWTGEWYTYSDQERNIHERMVKVWRLR
jgi:hypothetical protein